MTTEEAIKGILKHREIIHQKKQWDNPVQLSETMLKIATYNAYLADTIAERHKEATQGYLTAYKAARDMEATIGDSESLAKGESLDKRTQYENVKYIYGATDKLLSTMQTHLRTIENQIMREGQQ